MAVYHVSHNWHDDPFPKSMNYGLPKCVLSIFPTSDLISSQRWEIDHCCFIANYIIIEQDHRQLEWKVSLHCDFVQNSSISTVRVIELQIVHLRNRRAPCFTFLPKFLFQPAERDGIKICDLCTCVESPTCCVWGHLLCLGK